MRLMCFRDALFCLRHKNKPKKTEHDAGIVVSLLFCLIFSIIAPVFDADEEETWAVGFVRYAAAFWKWMLVGVGWSSLAAALNIYKG